VNREASPKKGIASSGNSMKSPAATANRHYRNFQFEFWLCTSNDGTNAGWNIFTLAAHMFHSNMTCQSHAVVNSCARRTIREVYILIRFWIREKFNWKLQWSLHVSSCNVVKRSRAFRSAGIFFTFVFEGFDFWQFSCFLLHMYIRKPCLFANRYFLNLLRNLNLYIYINICVFSLCMNFWLVYLEITRPAASGPRTVLDNILESTCWN